jgi:hypothetical protein
MKAPHCRARRSPSESSSETFVYDGRILRGLIVKAAGRFRAENAEGLPLGDFETSLAAARAILQAARASA